MDNAGASIDLDILGQLPSLKIYTQLCLCFPVADASSHSAITNILKNGLELLSESFPWLAGKVVNEGLCEGNTGTFKIKASGGTPPFVVKDIRHEPSAPTMDDLKQAGFPFRMLDESIIAPRRTLPSPEESAEDFPVFLLQATFVIGGLLLTFVGEHNVMDMTGQGQIIHLFSKACRNEPFTEEELSSGNLDRHDLIPLLDDFHEPNVEGTYQTVKPTSPPQSVSRTPPQCTWSYFCFSPISLAALKSLAAGTTTPATSYISTDDALSAFIWQSVARARVSRLDPSSQSTFGRAVDVRRCLDVPATYTGLFQNMTYNTEMLQNLVEQPLGHIAARLREALNPKTLAHRTRALATVLDRTADKSTVSFGGTVDPSTGMMISSWAKQDCYELDFGLGLGKPECVRRPRFDPFEGLMYLMPKALDGEIAVAICISESDMERLKADEEFSKFGRYVG